MIPYLAGCRMNIHLIVIQEMSTNFCSGQTTFLVVVFQCYPPTWLAWLVWLPITAQAANVASRRSNAAEFFIVFARVAHGYLWLSMDDVGEHHSTEVILNAALASMRDSGNWRMGLHVLTSPVLTSNDFSAVSEEGLEGSCRAWPDHAVPIVAFPS